MALLDTLRNFWTNPNVRTGVGVGSTLLGGYMGLNSGNSAARAGQDAAQNIYSSWDQAYNIYNEQLAKAVEALEAGHADLAARLMEGLGMSNEEIDKAVDLSLDALEWVVDFGKSGIDDYEGRMREANQYMDYHKGLVFNPDAIYGTKAYQSIKNRALQEWDNYYSGKGMLGGNAAEFLGDRMFQLGAGFRQGELGNALAGADMNRALANLRFNQVSLGADATRLGAQNIFTGGLQKGANTLNTYGALGESEAALGRALGNLYEGSGRFLGAGTFGAGLGAAEAILAGQLGRANSQGKLANALVSGGFNILGGMDNVLGTSLGRASSYGLGSTGAAGAVPGTLGPIFQGTPLAATSGFASPVAVAGPGGYSTLSGIGGNAGFGAGLGAGWGVPIVAGMAALYGIGKRRYGPDDVLRMELAKGNSFRELGGGVSSMNTQGDYGYFRGVDRDWARRILGEDFIGDGEGGISTNVYDSSMGLNVPDDVIVVQKFGPRNQYDRLKAALGY